jgi:hypothetical protein
MHRGASSTGLIRRGLPSRPVPTRDQHIPKSSPLVCKALELQHFCRVYLAKPNLRASSVKSNSIGAFIFNLTICFQDAN